jgi:hypothetical protein
MKQLLLVLILITTAVNYSYSQHNILKNSESGSYNVGFKHETVTDYSRSFGNTYRPIELFIWYPSNEKTDPTLNYTDYLLIKDKSKNLDSLILKSIERSGILEDKDLILKKYKRLKTSAIENTMIADGSYPLILFAPGGRTPGYLHSVICEYLASNGYIVVGLSALGNYENSRWPFDQTGLNLQIDDMSFAINYLKHEMSQINIDKICLASWSVGGVAQTLYAMKNSNIDMFVSLDSGIGRTYGIEMIKESPYFNYSKMDIPYLHFTGTQPEQFNVERSNELYDSIPSKNKYLKTIIPFAHQHFTSQNGLINDLISENQDKVLANAYLMMCYTTRVFVDAFLKEDTIAKTELLDLIKTE